MLYWSFPAGKGPETEGGNHLVLFYQFSLANTSGSVMQWGYCARCCPFACALAASKLPGKLLNTFQSFWNSFWSFILAKLMVGFVFSFFRQYYCFVHGMQVHYKETLQNLFSEGWRKVSNLWELPNRLLLGFTPSSGSFLVLEYSHNLVFSKFKLRNVGTSLRECSDRNKKLIFVIFGLDYA